MEFKGTLPKMFQKTLQAEFKGTPPKYFKDTPSTMFSPNPNPTSVVARGSWTAPRPPRVLTWCYLEGMVLTLTLALNPTLLGGGMATFQVGQYTANPSPSPMRRAWS